MFFAWMTLLLAIFLVGSPRLHASNFPPRLCRRNAGTAGGQTPRPAPRMIGLTGISLTLVTITSLAGCASEPPAAAPPTVEPTATTKPDEASDLPAEPPVCQTDPYGCAVIPPDQTIKIGMAGPLTGQYAAYGTDIVQAALLAIEDYGDYLGWQFELLAKDTQGDPGAAQYVAADWTHEPTLVAIAGHIFSGETEVAIPFYEEAGIPMLSPSATTPDLTRRGSKVFNRIVFTDAIQAEDAADYLYSSLGIRNLAVLHDGESYGQALAELTAENFEGLGGDVVDMRSILPGREDYLPTLNAIATSRPEAIYFGGYDTDAIVLINGMAELGMEDVIFFGCDSTFGEHLLTGARSSGESVYSASLIPPLTEQRSSFDQAYEDKWNAPPGSLSPYTWNGYDAVGALIFVIKQVALVGNDGNLYVPRGALVNAVRKLSDYPGVGGVITCDAVGECSTSGPTFYTIESGQWVPAP
jgi:branched-chain amino acid transport system substrate-binding protein